MTQGELEVLVCYWQKLLRLQDWEVRVRQKRAKDFNADDAWASCAACLPLKKANIEIIDEIDYDEDEWPYDPERLVVHELLHLHFAPLQTKDGTPEALAEEQAVELLSRGLLELHRTGASDGEGQEKLDRGRNRKARRSRGKTRG